MAKTPAGGKSLWDVGFKSIGIDEGWEGCGAPMFALMSLSSMSARNAFHERQAMGGVSA